MTKIDVSIILPCLNEEETIETCIRKAQNALNAHNINGEILIADNGSTDNSIRIATQNNAKVIHIRNKGYGNAVRGGIDAAEGDFIIMADADDSYDLKECPKFLNKLHEGYDLVMGNRFKGGIKKGAMPFLHRYLGNPVLSFIGKLFFNVKCGDFHCGMRGFKKSAILSLNLQTTGMEFASEMVLKASLFNLKIAEIPTTLSPDGRSRAPHLNTWRDGWRHLRFMLLFAPNWLFLYPGLLFIMMGIVSGAILWSGPKTFLGISLDIHTLLYSCAFILIGFQGIMFSLFSKVFAITEGLIPPNKRITRLIHWLTVEKILISSLILILIGLWLSITLILQWKRVGFGALNPVVTFRLLIPAILCLILGTQSVLYGFFLGTLKLGRRRLTINNV